MTNCNKCSLCGKELTPENASSVTREVELIQRQGGRFLHDEVHELCLACFGKLASLFGAKGGEAE